MKARIALLLGLVALIGAIPAPALARAGPITARAGGDGGSTSRPRSPSRPVDGSGTSRRRTGEIHTLTSTPSATRLFYDVAGVNGDGERGMLGIALHPRYPDKPFVYVYATRRSAGSWRTRSSASRDEAGSGRTGA